MKEENNTKVNSQEGQFGMLKWWTVFGLFLSLHGYSSWSRVTDKDLKDLWLIPYVCLCLWFGKHQKPLCLASFVKDNPKEAALKSINNTVTVSYLKHKSVGSNQVFSCKKGQNGCLTRMGHLSDSDQRSKRLQKGIFAHISTAVCKIRQKYSSEWLQFLFSFQIWDICSLMFLE